MAGNMAAGAVKNFATAVTGADVETREAVDGVVVAGRTEWRVEELLGVIVVDGVMMELADEVSGRVAVIPTDFNVRKKKNQKRATQSHIATNT